MAQSQTILFIVLVLVVGAFAQTNEDATLQPGQFRVNIETQGDKTIFVACTGPCQVTVYGNYDYQNYTKGLIPTLKSLAFVNGTYLYSTYLSKQDATKLGGYAVKIFNGGKSAITTSYYVRNGNILADGLALALGLGIGIPAVLCCCCICLAVCCCCCCCKICGSSRSGYSSDFNRSYPQAVYVSQQPQYYAQPQQPAPVVVVPQVYTAPQPVVANERQALLYPTLPAHQQ